jgi:hypothetical protein
VRPALLLCVLACDDTLFGVLDAPDTEAVVDPTYDDVEAIWLDSCAGCHTDGGAQGGLTLDAGAEVLVDVASTEAPAMNLIVFGDPEGSYLWLKITDAPEIVGQPMPQGQALSDGEIGTITNWIDGGAP